MKPKIRYCNYILFISSLFTLFVSEADALNNTYTKIDSSKYYNDYCKSLNISKTRLGHKKKIAVIFFGLLRSLPYTYKNIQNNILTPIIENGYEYDIFIHTYNLSILHNPRAKEINVPYNLNAQNINHLIGSVSYITNQDEFDNTVNYEELFKYGVYSEWGSGKVAPITTKNVVRQLNSLKLAWNVFKCSSISPISNWAGIIVLRPDTLQIRKLDIFKHDIPPQPNTVYIPGWGSNGGINDRIAYGSIDSMKLYTHRYDFMSVWTKKHKMCIMNEVMLQYYILQHMTLNVRNLDLLALRVRANGKVWPLDLHLKGVAGNTQKYYNDMDLNSLKRLCRPNTAI